MLQGTTVSIRISNYQNCGGHSELDKEERVLGVCRPTASDALTAANLAKQTARELSSERFVCSPFSSEHRILPAHPPERREVIFLLYSLTNSVDGCFEVFTGLFLVV